MKQEREQEQEQERRAKALHMCRAYAAQFSQPLFSGADLADARRHQGRQGRQVFQGSEVPVEPELEPEPDLVLVDVRSEPEQRVSIVQGAISQDVFMQTRLPELLAQLTLQTQGVQSELNKGVKSSLPCALPFPLVVPYCTIGYRSGRFAQLLVQQYGFPSARVRNGEGVVLFSYEKEVVFVRPKDFEGEGESQGESTRDVHVFGTDWDLCAADVRAHRFGWWSYVINGARSLFLWLCTFSHDPSWTSM
jgi:rhodanese-related sulfurtransferase